MLRRVNTWCKESFDMGLIRVSMSTIGIAIFVSNIAFVFTIILKLYK